MTREQIVWGIALNIIAAILVVMFLEPLLHRFRKAIFDRILSLNTRLMTAFFTKVARRDTSYVYLIVYPVNVIMGTFASYTLYDQHPKLSLAMSVLVGYGSIAWLVNFVAVLMAEQAIRIYNTARAQARPQVDEEYLIKLDSCFARIRSNADFDTVIEALKNGPVTNPRVPIDKA